MTLSICTKKSVHLLTFFHILRDSYILLVSEISLISREKTHCHQTYGTMKIKRVKENRAHSDTILV